MLKTVLSARWIAIGLAAIGAVAAVATLVLQWSDRDADAMRYFYSAMDHMGATARGPGELSITLYETRGGTRVDSADRKALENARRDIEQFERLRPSDPTAHLLRAAYYTRFNDLEAAEAQWKELLEDANEPALDGWMLLLAAKLDTNPHRARRLYESAVAKAPDDPRPLVIYGVHLHSLGENDEALVNLRRALAIDQGNPVSVNALAHVLTESGQASAAVDLLTHGMHRGLRLGELHNSLGYAYWVLEQYNSSAREFRRATEIHSNDPMYFQNLALALAKIGDIAGSTAAMSEARRLGLADTDFYKSGQPNGRI